MTAIEKVKEIIKTLLEKGIIRTSSSHIASPVFVVPKRNGELRLVIDYRRLNLITLQDQHPIHNITEQSLSLKGFKFFSQIDLNRGYYQIEVQPEDIPKTSFIMPFGQYEFLFMPFGLTNAPRTFQRAMNTLFHDLPYVRVYLDDILVMEKLKKFTIKI